MPKLALVTSDGQVVITDKPATHANEVEEHQEYPLHVIAERQHAKDSTKKQVNK
jgi:hypothetical protein